MPENLVQHRGDPSVWDRPRSRDAGRWIAALSAGALLATGLRQRSRARLLSVAGAAALATWAAMTRDARQRQMGWVGQCCDRWMPRQDDPVNEAAEESFPASDAPALTPSSRESGAFNGTRGLWPRRR